MARPRDPACRVTRVAFALTDAGNRYPSLRHVRGRLVVAARVPMTETHADAGPDRDTPSRGVVGVPRMPGLDGLRGLAVLAVLAFHQGFGWARGGYLGVSLFFTLSGFLIASLVIHEVSSTGRLALRAFWARRLRRLAPAALVALLLVCAFGATIATPSQRLDLRGDLWSALGNVMNWRLLASGQSYAALFRDPSPVQHFWSLAIEEQFYLLFPLLIAAITAISLAARTSGRRFRRRLAATALGLAAASLAAQLLITSTDRIYYGTDTRAFELLAGVLLACWITPGRIPRTIARAAAIIAIPLTLAMITAWSQVPLDSPWLYQGGLAAIAIVSAVVILGAAVPGPLRTLCSWAPLRGIGLISYGIYLFHWPIYLWLTPNRTGLHDLPLFTLRAAATLTIALASYHLIELPFRRGAIGRLRLAPAMWITALLTIATITPIAVAQPDSRSVITDADFKSAQGLVHDQERANAHTPPQPAGAAAPLKVYVVGDSTGVFFAGGLALFAQKTGTLEVRSSAAMACPFGPIATVRWIGEFGLYGITPTAECRARPDAWRTDLAQWRPDVILVVGGPTNSTEFVRDGAPAGSWERVTDPAGSMFLTRAIRDTADRLSRAAPGVPQLWFSSPYLFRWIHSDGYDNPDGPQVPADIDAYNATLTDLALRRGVTIVPWADYFNNLSLSDDAHTRIDGVHSKPEVIEGILEAWGWPKILAARDAAVTELGSSGQP
jgi:peptidoglycan/LPS O-acetylase OafA/YrhL